uniref:Uncharacterized protein n=1 Tax=Oryza barthii TaxID=65489 RepID=A0A0D3FQK4_9ORYZ
MLAASTRRLSTENMQPRHRRESLLTHETVQRPRLRRCERRADRRGAGEDDGAAASLGLVAGGDDEEEEGEQAPRGVFCCRNFHMQEQDHASYRKA